jgi:thymidylate kinase
MLIYIEGLDGSGKTTFANQLSSRLRFPVYRKLPPKNLPESEHHTYFKGVGYALVELRHLCSLNVIVDRSFVSDWVYSNRHGDSIPIEIWREWEDRHSESSGVLLVYVEVHNSTLEQRLKVRPDDYMERSDIPRYRHLYSTYLRNTRFPVFRIDGEAETEQRERELQKVGALIIASNQHHA